MRHYFKVTLLLLALTAGLIPQFATAQQATLPAPANLRVMHISPNAPALSVYIDGQPVVSEVDYATTTSYRSVAPGKHRLQVSLATDTVEQSIVDTTIDLIRGRPYTLVVQKPLETLQANLLIDSIKSPPAGQARVRVIHAAPTTGPVDVWPIGDSVPLLTDQYLGQVDELILPAGQYAFRFAVAGTTGSLLDSQQLRFEPGWSYTIALTGNGAETQEPLILHASVDRTAR